MAQSNLGVALDCVLFTLALLGLPFVWVIRKVFGGGGGIDDVTLAMKCGAGVVGAAAGVGLWFLV